MKISRWLCKSNTKHMFVKIVYPGGHVELHDRPILVAEIMQRNPRSVVAHPDIFKQPWAIVAPETMLMLGQKFYVVPMSTIMKLQRHYLRYSPSPVHSIQINSSGTQQQNYYFDHNQHEGHNNHASSPTCWLQNVLMSPCSVTKKSADGKKEKAGRELDKENCFMSLMGAKSKGNGCYEAMDGTGNSPSSSFGSSEVTKLSKKEFKGSPSTKMLMSIEWQPSLESIIEE